MLLALYHCVTMIGPKSIRPNLSLILFLLSVSSVAFESTGLSQPSGNGALIVQGDGITFNALNVDLGPLNNLRATLAGLLNTSHKEPSEDNPASLKVLDENLGDYSVLVESNKSSILVINAKGNIISRRPAGSDDSAAIKEAINITNKGTVLCIGTFSINSPIDNLKDDITLKGLSGQTVFDCSKMKTDIFLCGYEISRYSKITSPLEHSAIGGSWSVIVADPEDYKEGDFVKLVDNESIAGFKKGEILRIKKLIGNEIIFENPISDDYSVENYANIRKLAMTENVGVEGINFLGPGIETDITLFGLYLMRNFEFTDNQVANFGRVAVHLSDSLNATLENNTFENIYMTGLGYAIAITNACDRILIKDNIFRVMGRHYITAGAGTGSRSSGGFSRNIKIINNTFEDCIQEAINTHRPFVGPIEIIGNEFKSCGKGIEISNGNTIILDNTFKNCTIGIQLLGDERRSHDISSNDFQKVRETVLIETSNMTIYGNISHGRFLVDKDEFEFL